MPDTCTELNNLYCWSSYDNPLLTVRDWRIFTEYGFLPSCANTSLVAKVLAWNPVSRRYFCSLVGCEYGAFEYFKGMDNTPPEVFKTCVVNGELVRSGGYQSRVGEEVIRAVDKITAAICASDGLENPLLAQPLTMKDISPGERTLWIGDSRGDKCRVVLREDWSASFQVASSYDANGEPETWSVVW